MGKEEVANYLPQQRQPLSLEPSDPDDVVREWEHLHNNIHLHKKLRDFAFKVAAIHIDEGRGFTIKDIQTLLGCKTIDAAEARKDEAVRKGLLMPHSTLKDGKQKMHFLSNYIDVINEKLKRRSKESPVSPDDITFALIKILSHVNVPIIILL